MGSISYQHQAQPSSESRLVMFFMGLAGMKRIMEKHIAGNSYGKEPASIPKSILHQFNVEVGFQAKRKVWTISPKHSKNDLVILYLHGGAYYANITKMHWRWVEKILSSTKATIVVPDYPLAPESTCQDACQFLDAVYAEPIFHHPGKRVIFMGDSAGGGLALGFALKIKNAGIRQASEIMLFSPWLDVSMTNPDLAEFDKLDKILSLGALRIAGKSYAGELDLADFRVSPIHGDFSGLGRISLFVGTNELLIADTRKFKRLMEEQHVDFSYYEYPGMFHDWVVVSNLPETQDVMDKMAASLKSFDR